MEAVKSIQEYAQVPKLECTTRNWVDEHSLSSTSKTERAVGLDKYGLGLLDKGLIISLSTRLNTKEKS